MWRLLADGQLTLAVEAGLGAAVERWLPRHRQGIVVSEDSQAAVIRVTRGTPAEAAIAVGDSPTLRLGTASAWVSPAVGEVALRGASQATSSVDLRRSRAVCGIPTDVDIVRAGVDVYSMLTISAALLLGRMRRALVHAGATVAPDGRAWLLVGDSHAGKSTTVVNLITAGWHYLSDDQVVLSAAEQGTVMVEGWPRPFHLDEGWTHGTPSGARGTVDPARLGPGEWRPTAPLGGLLFPRVRAHAPTSLTPIARSDALGRLVRQSPWLLADRGAAAAVLALLQSAVSGGCYAASLGLDSYRDAERLTEALRPLSER